MSGEVNMEFVQRTALVSASLRYTNSVVSLFTIGMQMVLCTYGLSRFLQTRPEKRKGRVPYILLSFAILALSATSVGISLWLGFRDLYYSAPGMDYVRIRQRLHDVEMGIASMASMYGYVVLGDGLLLYRCYIIWSDFRWISIPPTLVYLGFIGLTITNITRHAHGHALASQPQILISQRIEFAYTFLTVGFNILTTSLIAFRLIRARKSFARALPGRNMRVYGVAARILVESAVPLGVFGLCAATAGVVNWVHLSEVREGGRNPDLRYAVVVGVFNSLYFNFAALSPQMIIFRVTTGRSFTARQDDAPLTDSEPGRADTRPLSQPLAFNVGLGSESTTSGGLVQAAKFGKEGLEDLQEKALGSVRENSARKDGTDV